MLAFRKLVFPLERAVQDYEAVRMALLEQFRGKDQEGNPLPNVPNPENPEQFTVPLDSDRMGEFTEEIAALLSAKIKLPAIRASLLIKMNDVSTEDFVALGDIVFDDMEESDDESH